MALGEYRNDEYIATFTEEEEIQVDERRRRWAKDSQLIVGINTGCASTIPFKKFTVEYHRQLIQRLVTVPRVKVALLGGPEDTLRNQRIASGLPVIQSPTERGLRDGLCSAAACDIVVSGDSLGMHMAIALKKWVVAWFGPTCPQEIELYGRGVKITTKATCSPCWKRSCDRHPMCYDLVAFGEILDAVRRGIIWKTSSSKPHFSETSSSPSPSCANSEI